MKNLQEASIYVGTYRKYNEGSLFGEWVNLDQFSTKEEFEAYCLELHKDEEDPKLMFQDHENIPESLIGESWLSDDFWEIKEKLSDMDEDTAEAYMIFCTHTGGDLIDSFDNFEEAYCGYHNGHNPELDYAEQLFDEIYLHDVPESVRYYIDYEKFARDLFMSDYWQESGHIFRNI